MSQRMDKDLTTSILLIHQRLNQLEINLAEKRNTTRSYSGKSMKSPVNVLQVKRNGDGVDVHFMADVNHLIDHLLEGYRQTSWTNYSYFIDDELSPFHRHYRTLTRAEKRHFKNRISEAFRNESGEFETKLMEGLESWYPDTETIEKRVKGAF